MMEDMVDCRGQVGEVTNRGMYIRCHRLLPVLVLPLVNQIIALLEKGDLPDYEGRKYTSLS